MIDMSKEPVTKSKTVPSQCKICGAPALYKYFGTISCHACKIFFKRNAQIGLKGFKCDLNDNCEINIHNRHICTLCRLRKCFTSGMQINMIRCSRKTNTNKSHFKKRITNNETHQIHQLSLLNLNLNINQYHFLLNLIHFYDEYDILSHIQQFIQEQTSLPIKLRFKITSLDRYFSSILSGIEVFFKLNENFLSLSSNNCSILLRYVMENAGNFTIALISHKIPYFQYSNMRNSSENSDIIFVKLGILIFIFSTINIIDLDYLKLSKDLLEIQNIYTEIAWRYLLYKYDYFQAVIYFTNFIKSLLNIHTTIIDIHQSEQYKHLIENLLKKINQTIIIRK